MYRFRFVLTRRFKSFPSLLESMSTSVQLQADPESEGECELGEDRRTHGDSVTPSRSAMMDGMVDDGELWQAESAVPAALGEQVRVRGLRDLTLLVERVP